jgi:hypothetical protein
MHAFPKTHLVEEVRKKHVMYLSACHPATKVRPRQGPDETLFAGTPLDKLCRQQIYTSILEPPSENSPEM